MDERTVAFIGGGVVVLAWVLFWNGLFRGWAHTHPNSKTGQGYLVLAG